MKNPSWLHYINREKALEVQKEMAAQVSLEDCTNQPIASIGGMDVSNTPFDHKQMIFGAMVSFDYPSLSIREKITQTNRQTVPYISGLLGFREAPILVQIYEQGALMPDLLMIDGHGISHPRGLGIASHIGVLLDIPTIGVAKSILVGTPASQLGDEVGAMVPLLWKGKEIAMMVRTKKRCAPLIISVGHKISLKKAIEIVMSCVKKHRLPEPTRHAHMAANECRRAFKN